MKSNPNAYHAAWEYLATIENQVNDEPRAKTAVMDLVFALNGDPNIVERHNTSPYVVLMYLLCLMVANEESE